MHRIDFKIKKAEMNKRSKVRLRAVISMTLAAALFLTLSPGKTFARQGDSGYEGGLSSGETPSMTALSSTSKYKFQYQEPCFLSGVPVIMKGDLTLSKKVKTNSKTNAQTLTTTYVYSLKGGATNQNTLARTLTFVTTITPQDNGQKTESTILSSATENVKIDGITYKVNNGDYELTKSILNDSQPAVNYYSGELLSRKTYRMVQGTNTSDSVVVDSTTNYTGYDEYWSSAEAQIISQTITQCKLGKAPVIIGNVDMEVSTTTKKELKYYENLPELSSIQGGYVQNQVNENILKYTANLTELDKKKLPTGKIVTYTDSLSLDSFPSQTRLVSPNLNQIRGHASEENIALMFGLEAYKNPSTFNPQKYISRAEFIDAFVKVAKEVPLDPAFTTKKTTTTKSKKTVVTSPFADVPTNSAYFTSINDATKRGIIAGNVKGKFRPNDSITVAEAVTIMINSVGLESLAPNPVPVTSFKDNNSIPSYAKASMYVAEKIGLISEDSKGYIYPNNKITKAKMADMMKIFIDYMGSGIRKEYTERLASYN